MMAKTNRALSSDDLHRAVVCHLRIAARVHSERNSVPLLGSLVPDTSSCDGQM